MKLKSSRKIAIKFNKIFFTTATIFHGIEMERGRGRSNFINISALIKLYFPEWCAKKETNSTKKFCGKEDENVAYVWCFFFIFFLFACI